MAIDIASALARATAPGAARFARSISVRKYNEFIAIYTNAFNEFLNTSYKKCSDVKTILNQEVAVPLKEIYANSRLSYGGAIFDDENVLRNLKDGSNHMAITGLAGSGKSMLMRWLAVSLFDSILTHQKIPLFIEIRDLELGEKESPALDELIFEYCAHPLSKRNLDQFRIGLRDGLFIILLDGIDEAPPEKLPALLRSLSRFIESYGNCAIVASARPGTQLTNLARLYVYQVEPLNLEKVVEVVKKAPYDERRKQLLIKALEGGLYTTHQSFLSNPLLVTITLITFDDASRIPDNLTGFYAAAFDALFTKHDWAKGIFTRKRYSGLEKADFERIFQYFCYQSYFASNYAFSRDEVLDLIEKSASLAGVEVSSQLYLDDCVVSVCLFVVDEPRYVFVHRSFQEFFTARFVASYMGERAPELLSWLADRGNTDNTFIMVGQMNRELAIRHWGLPHALELRDMFSKWLEESPLKVLKYSGIDEVECELATGEVVAVRGRATSGYDLLKLIATLTAGSDFAGSASALSVNAYSGKKFSELDGSLQSFLRGVLDSEQKAHLRITAAQNIPAIRAFTANLAESQLQSVTCLIESFQNFIRARDEIAGLVRLVQTPQGDGKRPKE